jgi:hypothetical protein
MVVLVLLVVGFLVVLPFLPLLLSLVENLTLAPITSRTPANKLEFTTN